MKFPSYLYFIGTLYVQRLSAQYYNNLRFVHNIIGMAIISCWNNNATVWINIMTRSMVEFAQTIQVNLSKLWRNGCTVSLVWYNLVKQIILTMCLLNFKLQLWPELVSKKMIVLGKTKRKIIKLALKHVKGLVVWNRMYIKKISNWEALNNSNHKIILQISITFEIYVRISGLFLL